MKILVVRFSSIGDIVLTSPVIHAIKSQLKDVEIHYLTKKPFESLVSSNPSIRKVLTIEKSIDEVMPQLKAENYDRILDLHNNVRSRSLKMKLKKPMDSFPKLNWQKWLLVRFKVNKMPKVHVVDRYFLAAKNLGVKKDSSPIQFYIDDTNQVDVFNEFEVNPNEFIAIAIGAQFATKRMPIELLKNVLEEIKKPVVLIGGEVDKEMAIELMKISKANVKDATGKYNLQQSASIVQQANKLLTNDTGMMHIAAAFNTQIISVWGNTTPDLGMYPYRASEESFSVHEVDGLKCRPCSKIGYQECPKKHFRCMMDQDVDAIIKDLN